MNQKDESAGVALCGDAVRLSLERGGFTTISLLLTPHEAEALARLLNSASADAILAASETHKEEP